MICVRWSLTTHFTVQLFNIMISYRKADLLTNIQSREIEVVVNAMVGQSSIETERFFVFFERPISESESLRENMDSRLRGILEAKSYKKVNDNFILTGIPNKEKAEQEFSDVLKLLRHHNSIISVSMDPFTWLAGTRIKSFVIRMKTRG